MSVSKNIISFKKELPANVRLVAVSKTKPVSVLFEAYQAGQLIFGENKVQELCDKYEQLPKDIEWHFIGHLQRNKVKFIAPFVTLIHGVDSLRLLEKINEEAQKNNRLIDCLLQVHIAKEDTKFGFDETELIDLLNDSDYHKLENIRICGLMGMATYTDDNDLISREFKSLADLFNKVKSDCFFDKSHFTELSMGMSGDYQIAVEQGATLVRIGSSLFGTR